jgi:glucan 1,3-beta-glucosidase
VNQARFVRELARAAAAERARYNVIEAFDQPWKRRLEGTVGGFWGVLDAAGGEKFPLRGPVVEDPAWRRGLAAAAAGAIFLVFAGVAGRLRRLGLVALALAGSALGAALAAQHEFIRAASRDVFELALGTAYGAISAVATLLAALSLARWTERRPPFSPAPAAAIAAWFRTNVSPWSTAGRLLGSLRFALLFGAAAASLALAFDPRYRDFPLAIAAPPAVALALLAWVAGTSAAVEERALAAVLVATAPLIAVSEGLANTDALAWAALCLAFAASVWRPWAAAGRAREHQEAEEAAGSAGDGRVQHEAGGAEAGRAERPG